MKSLLVKMMKYHNSVITFHPSPTQIKAPLGILFPPFPSLAWSSLAPLRLASHCFQIFYRNKHKQTREKKKVCKFRCCDQIMWFDIKQLLLSYICCLKLGYLFTR